MKDVKLEKYEFRCEVKAQSSQKAQVVTENRTARCGRQGSEENRSSNALSNTGHSSSSVLEQGQSPVDDTGVSSASAICPAPICQQFWKAGNYEDRLSSKIAHQNGKNYLHVHPMFLHSNATSHKWAFGAIAELLDNAVDEIQNGATFVIVDKTTNPRDGSLALLIQDDGGGMDPEVMRQCMSFGFSGKKSKSAIGRYGNGFKTSTMRLGADVIVFSRHLNDRVFTQSIGLLSYTFLTQTRSDRIVVPMVDYEFNATTGNLEISSHYGKEHFMTNLAMLLQWSPYSTEVELLKQFDDIGPHGTKVIIYNLWFADESNVELDFDTDPEDIRICGVIKEVSTKAAWKELNAQHIANRLHYSLRVYLSILYLRLPNTFSIVLCGRPVEHHNLADDLKFQEFILYRPQSGGCIEGQVITTIGFLKEAPNVNVHGFNVYHKNRLILPFWPVVSYFDSRGKGVVGVLEANFIEPTHNKQDFERTSLFQKLEVRLKEMTWEYWDYHCGLIGYQVKKKIRAPETPQGLSLFSSYNRGSNPVTLNQGSSVVHGAKIAFSAGMKRKENANLLEPERLKRQLGQGTNALIAESNSETKRVGTAANQLKYDEATNLKQKNEKLHAQCLEYEKKTGELDQKAHRLRTELKEVQREYDRLMAEVASMDSIKEENVVNV